MAEKLLQFVLKYWNEINGYGRVTEDSEHSKMYCAIPIDLLLEAFDMSFKEFSEMKSNYDVGYWDKIRNQ